MFWWSLRKLRSWNITKREEAIDELARSRDARSTDALASVLGDKDSRVSTRAANALLKKGDIQSLHYLVNSTVQKQRCDAAAALAAGGDRIGINALVRMLLEPSGVGVCETIQALIEAGVDSPEVTDALTDILNNHCADGNTDIACKVLEAFGEIGDRRASVIDALGRAMLSPSVIHWKAETVMRQLGKPAQVEKAIKTKERNDAQRRAEAVQRRRRVQDGLTSFEIISRVVNNLVGKGRSAPLPETWAEDMSLVERKLAESTGPTELSKVCEYLLGLRPLSATPWDKVLPRLPNTIKRALIPQLENAVIEGGSTASDSKWWLTDLGWTPQERFFKMKRAYELHHLEKKWPGQYVGLSRLLAELPIVPTDSAMRYLNTVSLGHTLKAHQYILERSYDRNSEVLSDASVLYMSSGDDVIHYVLLEKYACNGTDASELVQNSDIDQVAGHLKIPVRWHKGNWTNDENDRWLVTSSGINWFLAMRVGRNDFLCGSDHSHPAGPRFRLRDVAG